MCCLAPRRGVRFDSLVFRFPQDLSASSGEEFGLATQRIKDAHLEGIDLSSWQVALCGAEPVHHEGGVWVVLVLPR